MPAKKAIKEMTDAMLISKLDGCRTRIRDWSRRNPILYRHVQTVELGTHSHEPLVPEVPPVFLCCGEAVEVYKKTASTANGLRLTHQLYVHWDNPRSIETLEGISLADTRITQTHRTYP